MRKDSYVLNFNEIDRKSLPIAGGKGANLGELSRIEGIRVPDGFCITTDAYRELTENHQELNLLLTELEQLPAENHKVISETSNHIHQIITNIEIPPVIQKAISDRLLTFGETDAYAVRSSATAEDLPTASFAGQQDTFLNVTGTESILKHIPKCWASLFTERAVTYRIQHGFGHRQIQLSVVIQKMVFPQVSGIMFTADPITSNRNISSIDAGYGLGEALVSGLVNADTYRIQGGQITDRKIPLKKHAIYPLPEGGTMEQELEPENQHEQVLTDLQILELERIGRRIEAHFGYPQDIEWCLDNGVFYIVQSRPITTLFPVPEVADNEKHVYVSVGHQQMMTDAMKPLGISFWQLSTSHPMHTAGGRLFLDISKQLASQTGRDSLLNTLGKSDPLSKDALTDIMERNIIPLSSEQIQPITNKLTSEVTLSNDPEIVTELIRKGRKAIQELHEQIRTKTGSGLLDFIREDLGRLRQLLFDPKGFQALMAGITASAWINEHMQEWLGEKNAADVLSQSLDNNVTSEMGLALMDVADIIRLYPEIRTFLENTPGEDFLHEIKAFNGGEVVHEAITHFLDQYGMRCAGEIDITKTRWGEKPTILIPLLLNNIRNFEPQAGKRKFELGRAEALEKEQELLTRLKQLPDGEEKASETRQRVAQLRIFSGYREYPKYLMINHYFEYKQALMKEAENLELTGVLSSKEDIFFLRFEELQDIFRTGKVDQQLIQQRKDAFKTYEKLTPPRFITSDGEVISGRYKREDLPENALAGLAVSTGVIEGRARVILTMEQAVLEEGDILVTTFTDPSWTPLFVSIKGLVTEVGGLMTHGAVIAREYGLPAVVGVENATKLITDGQRIRVNGSEGWVEIL